MPTPDQRRDREPKLTDSEPKGFYDTQTQSTEQNQADTVPIMSNPIISHSNTSSGQRIRGDSTNGTEKYSLSEKPSFSFRSKLFGMHDSIRLDQQLLFALILLGANGLDQHLILWSGGAAPLAVTPGVAIAGLLLGGLRLWPAIVLVFLGWTYAAESTMREATASYDFTSLIPLGLALGTALVPLISVLILRLTLRKQKSTQQPINRFLESPIRLWWILLLTVILPASLLTILPLAVLVWENFSTAFPPVTFLITLAWQEWRVTATGLLLLIPTLLVLIPYPLSAILVSGTTVSGSGLSSDPASSPLYPQTDPLRFPVRILLWLEGGGVIFSALLILGMEFSPWLTDRPTGLTLLLFVPVLWAGLRLSQSASCLLVLMLCMIILIASLLGYGPMLRLDGVLELPKIQGFFAVLMMISLILSTRKRAIIHDNEARDITLEQLHQSKHDLIRQIDVQSRNLSHLQTVLDETHAQATASEELQIQFLAAIAHEIAHEGKRLRTALPLTGLLAEHSILKNKFIPFKTFSGKTVSEPLKQAGLALDRLQALGRETECLVALATDQLTLTSHPFNLAILIENIAMQFANDYPGRIICFVDPVLPEEFIGDVVQIQNLASVAIDMMLSLSLHAPVLLRVMPGEQQNLPLSDKHLPILETAESQAQSLLLCLESITPVHWPQCEAGCDPMALESFLALGKNNDSKSDQNSVTPYNTRRTGALGWWLAGRMAQMMGGEMQVRTNEKDSLEKNMLNTKTFSAESETFVAAWIPLAPAFSRSAPRFPNLKGLKLLVVEANPVQRNIIIAYLEACGSETVSTEDAEEATSQLYRDAGDTVNGFDIAIIDGGLRLGSTGTLLDRLVDSKSRMLFKTQLIVLRPIDQSLASREGWRPPGRPGSLAATLDRPIRRTALYAALTSILALIGRHS